MGARTGHEYIEAVDAMSPTVYIEGETLRGGLSQHPAFEGIVRTYAELYDLQHVPELQDRMTYESPTTGDRVGMSFLVPTTQDDLVRRREMMKTWADHGCGMLGRSGDYLNSSLMALSQAQGFFDQADPAFGRNVAAYYELARERDLLTTHTLIAPQANRSQAAAQQMGGSLAAKVVKEDDNGIVISGARLLATIGPFSDEILVFPSTVLRTDPEDAPYAYAFAIPSDHPGLKYVCRGSLVGGASSFDHPLSSRFEEMDAVVVFDDVHVPYERVFMLGRPDLCNGFYTETSSANFMTQQVVTRTIAKTEFFLGLISLVSDTIGIEQFSHVQEDIAEVIVTLEVLKGLMRASEADATLNAYGVMTPSWWPLNAARNWFPRLSQRLPQIVRKLAASGLMALPTEADIAGEAGADIERFLQSATLGGEDRVRLFRLAADAAISSFSGRQALYEYYFFGDPIRMSSALVKAYDREPYMERVQAFLDRETAVALDGGAGA